MSSKDIEVATQDDETDEDDGGFTITLASGSGYTIGSDASVTVSVADDDEPVVQLPIIAIEDVIADGRPRRSGGVEGQTFVFVFSATPAPRSEISVKVDVDIEGDYLDSSPEQSESSVPYYVGTKASAVVTFVAGAATGKLQVATVNDTNDEPNGSIAMTLEQGTDYLVTKTTKNTRSLFLVDNDDAPVVAETNNNSSEVVLSIKANKPRITEGDNVVFEVRASKSSKEKLPLKLEFSGNDKDFIQTTKTTHAKYLSVLKFAARPKAALVFYLPTKDDDVDEEDTEIIATLLPGNGYTVETGTNSAKVIVVDNDEPRISISAASDEAITEGEAVRFVVRAIDRAVESELAVNVSITQNSDFIASRIPKGVNIAKGRQIAGLNFDTVDDGKVQEDGAFTATITTGDGYQISNQNSATVSINDNDSKEDRRVEPRISIAGVVMNALLSAAGPNPTTESNKITEVSISANTDEIVEGDRIGFTIQASPAPSSTLVVKVAIDSPNGSIQESSPVSVTLNAGSSSALLELTTLDDNELEAVEVITVSIVEQSEYLVSSDAGRASVRVSDQSDWQRQEEIETANREVIPEMVGRMNAQPLNRISERIRQGFANNSQNSLQIAGNESLTGILEQSGGAVNNDQLLRDTLFNDSSFTYNLVPESSAFGSTTTWGTGKTLEFQKNSIGNSTLNGEIHSSQLGLDVNVNQSMIAGFSGSYADSEVKYKSSKSTLDYTAKTNGLFPYLGWQSTDGANYLNVIGGIGIGSIRIRQQGHDWNTLNSTLYSADVSGGLQLFSSSDPSIGVAKELNVKTGVRAYQFQTERDIGIVGGIDQHFAQSNLMLEGLYTKYFSNGSVLKPNCGSWIASKELKKMINNLGSVLASELTLVGPTGLTISAAGNTFLTLENQRDETTFQGKLAFDSNYDDLGLIFRFIDSVGIEQFR